MAPPATATAPEPDPSPTAAGGTVRVQLLLRNIDSRTIVIRAQPEDTLNSVLERLGNARMGDLRAQYANRCLPGEATIGELGLPPDATLDVMARLLSTLYPDAWNLAAEIAASTGRPFSAAYLDMLVENFLNSARAANKSYTPLGPVADHMAIFLLSGAPGVLVQLYLFSSDLACRAGTECAIRCFVMSDLLNPHGRIKAWTAPILVEFCRSIAAARQADDPLYANLRNALAAVLCDPGWSPTCWLGAPPDRLAWFVVEKAGGITDQIKGAQLMQATGRKDLADFKLFSSVLRDLVHRLDVNASCLPWWRAVHHALVSLLCYVDLYMATYEKVAHSTSAQPNWTPALPCVWVTLAEVDGWVGAEWLLPELRRALRATLVRRKVATRALAIRAGMECCESTGRVARHRDLLDFEARRHLAMMALPRLAFDRDHASHQMLIDRPHVAYEAPEKLRVGLSVEFTHEEAAGPGVRRESFCMVFQALFSPRHVLFTACPSDRRRFFVNPASAFDPLHRQNFELPDG